jgi:4-phosphopantoate--beta-alanine ligase
MDIHVPENHPRYRSISIRESLVEASRRSVVAPAGLIAHGRGEAFDYLIGEQTPPPAMDAVRAAARMLLAARRPVLSVNGNAAALSAPDLVELSRLTGAALEVNLFYRSLERERAIERVLAEAGAEWVLGVGDNASDRVPEVGSERRKIDPEGIGSADLVFVPLEDGDRTEGLIGMGKRVITVDLNPLSRTSQKASLTIVDNLVRCMPLLVEEVRRLKEREPSAAGDSAEAESRKMPEFDNAENLRQSLAFIRDRLRSLTADSGSERAGGGDQADE